MSWVSGYANVLRLASRSATERPVDGNTDPRRGSSLLTHSSSVASSADAHGACNVPLMVQEWFVAINAFEHACRCDGMFLESSHDLLLHFGVRPAAVSASTVCRSDAPPSSRIMGRWTLALLWLLGERLDEGNCSDSESLVALSFAVVSAARLVCPLQSAVLRKRSIAAQARHHQISNHGSRFVNRRGDDAVECNWTPLDRTLALASVALFHTDNFRVSLQHYDPQVVNGLVLQRLDAVQAKISRLPEEDGRNGNCSIGKSLTLQPCFASANASATAATAASMQTGVAAPDLVSFVSRMLLWHLQVYAWRFASGWVSAGVVLRDTVCLLFPCDDAHRQATSSASEPQLLPKDAVTVLRLFLSRVLDHIAYTITSQCLPCSTAAAATGQEQRKKMATSDTLRGALVYFLTYVWEPAVLLMMPPLGPCRHPEPHAHTMLRVTLLSSAVAMFSTHLASAATTNVPRNSVVQQLSVVADTLNDLQDYVAADKRCSRETLRAVLETLAATR